MFTTLGSSKLLLNLSKCIKDRKKFSTITIVEVKTSKLEELKERMNELGADLLEKVNGNHFVFQLINISERPDIQGMKPGFYLDFDGNVSVIVHYLNGDVLVTGGIKRRSTDWLT